DSFQLLRQVVIPVFAAFGGVNIAIYKFTHAVSPSTDLPILILEIVQSIFKFEIIFCISVSERFLLFNETFVGGIAFL
ncbi:hypothetical protein, partial [Anaerotruncus colihominis]|uniref:hypothetical protein n=1 Tax=Anaerotruncus colihominis TaxID=169435 RepID=UPI0035143692